MTQMTLLQIEQALKPLRADLVLAQAFGKPMSYRGFYDQIAFEPATNKTVAELRQHVRAAYGTFTGYKGGEYTMDSSTLANVAEYGACGDVDEDEFTFERFQAMLESAQRDQATPTPAASRVATLSAEVQKIMEMVYAYADAFHDRCEAEDGDAGTAFKQTQYEISKRIRDAITAFATLEAAQPASPAPLTDEQVMEIMSLHDEAAVARRDLRVGGKVPAIEADRSRYTRRRLNDYLAALASPQVASAPAKLDFTKPLETIGGEPVKHVCHDVIEYKSARVSVDAETGRVYSSPYFGLMIRNVAAPVQVAPHPAYLEARDAILHDRGPLEGEGLTSEQTNAVLAVLDDAFAAAPVAPQDDARDAARLDFLIEQEARVTASRTYTDPKLTYQCWGPNEDDDYRYLSGEHLYFDTAREAIDAAIALSTPAAKPTEEQS